MRQIFILMGVQLMSKRLLKLVSTVCMTVLIGSAFVGCGSSSGDGSKSSSGSGDSVTLTFGSHQSGLPTSGVVQDLAKDFEKETGIKIDFQNFSGCSMA